MNLAIDLLLMINLVCAVGLIACLRWWQKKHGKLSEKRFALSMCGFLTFATITTFFPLLLAFPRQTILIEVVLLLAWWGLGYPWACWLMKQFRSSK